MKLTNIFFLGLALLVGTACSKDDSQNRIEKAADATLKIAVKSSGTMVMKADDLNERPGEANVKNLAVLVFDEAGTGLLGAPAWAEVTTVSGSPAILNVPCKSLKAQIVIVANSAQGVFSDVANMTDFQSRLAQLASQSQDELTMSSRVIKTDVALKQDDNYLGYKSQGASNVNGIDSPVDVARLVARVELTNVATKFAGTKLDGRTLRIDEVYVANQKTASRYFSLIHWGTVEATGHLTNSTPTAIGKNVTDATSLASSYTHYVMENESAAEAPTRLIVKATLLATTGYAAETKEFAATINKDGIDKGYTHNYVKRNYVYRLSFTFGANSFGGEPTPPVDPVDPVEPETGVLEVQVEVLGWGPISQDVVVE